MNILDKSPFDFEPPKADEPNTVMEELDFNFDQLQPTDVIPAQDEIGANPAVHNRLMPCICPACAGNTEVDLEQMSEQKFIITCSGCAKQIHVIRESSACRAKRKSFEINCAHCGNLLDHHAHCKSCGKSFPDFFVIVDPAKARSESRKVLLKKVWTAITDLNVSFKPSFNRSSQKAVHGYSPTKITSRSSESSLLSRRYLVPALSLIVAIALCAGGVFAYKAYATGQMYAENYIKALYCIKTGIDTNLKRCVVIKTDWETATVAGRSFLPNNNLVEETKASKLRTEIDKYMQLINTPPKKFYQADSKIKEFHKVYLGSESLRQARLTSLVEFSSSINTLDKKMSQISQEIKSNLPGTLKQELEKAKLKYRGLNDF
ncbi:MAG: hypothetical protein ACOYL3_23120 [Desulfuromonadaceae bacterium]